MVRLWFSKHKRDIELAFKGPVPDAEELTLRLDGVSLSFPAGSSGKPIFVFKNVDISWTEGQVVAASIVR